MSLARGRHTTDTDELNGTMTVLQSESESVIKFLGE